MGRTSEDEAKEQKRNEHLQGDHRRAPQKVGHGAPTAPGEGNPPEPPTDPKRAPQQGGTRSH